MGQQFANIRDVNQRLSHFIEAAENGDEVIIMRRGKPVAKLASLNREPGLTAEQNVAKIRCLKRMKAGYHLGGKRLNRDQAHAR